ncbi:PLD nuclease N-terminal domain-containing protein [Kineococcus sp. TBRC 1896]|uniref:PLD nuclease N-terminal domain-containing protein n=1 Tax=Kineococcus mangrovi TaxID=1660183 RepID=A0ABV4HWK1_9ACTN
MIRYLPVVLELVLLVFCLLDCVQTPADRVRNLPKLAWILLIVVLPVVGGVAWLVAGRPARVPQRPEVWYSATPGFPEHERPTGWAGAERGRVDERVAQEQARVDADFDAAVRRARARNPEPPTGAPGA